MPEGCDGGQLAPENVNSGSMKCTAHAGIVGQVRVAPFQNDIEKVVIHENLGDWIVGRCEHFADFNEVDVKRDVC